MWQADGIAELPVAGLPALYTLKIKKDVKKQKDIQLHIQLHTLVALNKRVPSGIFQIPAVDSDKPLHDAALCRGQTNASD